MTTHPHTPHKPSHISSTVWGIIIATVLAGGLIYYASATYISQDALATTQVALASSSIASQQAIVQLRANVATLQSENSNLSSNLSVEQRNRIALEQVKATNERQIDTLTKLTTIDPELIKKYSKVYFLSENYVPANLVDIASSSLVNPKKETKILDKVSPFLTYMINDANAAGVDLLVISAYRSFGTQSTLKAAYKEVYGAGTANSFSADQGYSEHQLGTALDFGTTDVPGATLDFEDSAAFAWLNKNAYKYGFIISYPKANKFYEYEPWHWRFVGRKLAGDLHTQGKYFYEMDQRDIDKYLINLFD